MIRDAASQRQVDAADPAHSTWLSANAGSGKTRVLTDRVARLLLGGTEPQHILCLTYTKAAASEMQNRLFQRLGAWAMLDEPRLQQELARLGVPGPVGAETLAEARRLFARAIETPGGLKIQTIHSFCAGLLRRFPLEAGVAPGFSEMDDRAASLLRGEILEEMAAGGDLSAIDALASLHSGHEIDALLARICAMSAEFPAQALDHDAARRLHGLAPGFDAPALTAQVLTGNEAALLAALRPLLLASGTNDRKLGESLAQITLPTAEGAGDAAGDAMAPGQGLSWLAALEGCLLTGAAAKQPFSAKIGSLPTKALREGKASALMPAFEALMARVEAARPQRLALQAAQASWALRAFASAFLPRYEAAKAARGWLDFDDLIRRAGRLLSDRSLAQWVLFRLDGGIDHILVDEAQDTSPGQWAVIERLSEEFTAGEGARDTARTIFVVGDKKQSIYSFQGADLAAFDRMQRHFDRRFRAVGADMALRSLDHSFRSSEAVLRVVDATFDGRGNRGIGGDSLHIAFRDQMPGRVDLWPLIAPSEKSKPDQWDNPVDLLPEAHHHVQLARRIAEWIAQTIAAGTQIPHGGGARPCHEGDFLILVQRRSELFGEIIAACKARGLAIAGADRLNLSGELAVKDIRSTLAFLATPEDDLALAEALRSPLFGLDEAALYALAQPRGKAYLWESLRKSDHSAALAILHDLRNRTDFLRPFELIERLLTRHGGRARLIARLGPEAEDGIDELLSQALAFERHAVPSLTGFLVWLEGGEVIVKRQAEAAGRAIRVMTVHGAKGLEAPIVLMPDTIRQAPRAREQVLSSPAGPLWSGAAEISTPILAEARDRLRLAQTEERDRLLYVAMTRAECWLVVCGAGDPKEAEDQWWSLVEQAMNKLGAPQIELPVPVAGLGPIRRFDHGLWPDDQPLGPAEAPQAATAQALPAWARGQAPAPDLPPAVLLPSDLGGAKVLPGDEAWDDAGEAGEAARAYGTGLHLLLEHLPLHPPAAWQDLAAGLLAPLTNLPQEAILAEARAVLCAPDLAPLWSAEALAEVELTARIGPRQLHGVIDRLLIGPDSVLAIDFKSNRHPPANPEQIPEGLLRQMGAYGQALDQIWPGRRVELALLWTKSALLMPVPRALARQALARAPAMAGLQGACLDLGPGAA